MWPFGKRSNKNQRCKFVFMHGLSNFKFMENITILQDDSNGRLSIFRGKRPPVYLDYDQITDAIIVTRQEILDLAGYVPEYVKRNIYLGDLIHTVGPKYLGPQTFMVINYIPQHNPNTIETISVGIISISAKKFCEELQSKLFFFDVEVATSSC